MKFISNNAALMGANRTFNRRQGMAPLLPPTDFLLKMEDLLRGLGCTEDEINQYFAASDDQKNMAHTIAKILAAREGCKIPHDMCVDDSVS